jgi:hypothetical protein
MRLELESLILLRRSSALDRESAAAKLDIMKTHIKIGTTSIALVDFGNFFI